MTDNRYNKLAQVLVNYSNQVKNDDLAFIWGSELNPVVEPLVREICLEVLRAGGHPYVFEVGYEALSMLQTDLVHPWFLVIVSDREICDEEDCPNIIDMADFINKCGTLIISDGYRLKGEAREISTPNYILHYMSDLYFGWMFQFESQVGPAHLEITNVTLGSTTIPANNYVDVEVEITNMGSAAASGYDLVLIPSYGLGPPNPGGFQAIPELEPGTKHTVIFSPGVLYGRNLGTFTLRILVTDDWYALSDPNSTGTAGDYEDHKINVVTIEP